LCTASSSLFRFCFSLQKITSSIILAMLLNVPNSSCVTVCCVVMKVRSGSWPGLIQSMAACWPLAATTGRLYCGRSRTPAGPRSMNIQIMTHQVQNLSFVVVSCLMLFYWQPIVCGAAVCVNSRFMNIEINDVTCFSYILLSLFHFLHL